MRPDSKALFELFIACFVLALVVMAILGAIAAGVLPQREGVYAAAFIFIAGAIVLGQLFSKRLRGRIGPR